MTPDKNNDEFLKLKTEDDIRAKAAKREYAIARGLDYITLKPPKKTPMTEGTSASGHFIHMNKLLERSRRSCAKFANDAKNAEKELRETVIDRDRWKARAMAAEAHLASIGQGVVK